jgi:hypothetical protein
MLSLRGGIGTFATVQLSPKKGRNFTNISTSRSFSRPGKALPPVFLVFLLVEHYAFWKTHGFAALKARGAVFLQSDGFILQGIMTVQGVFKGTVS